MATETQTTTTATEASAPKATAPAPSMTHLPQQQQTFDPPLIANDNAFLGDVATSLPNLSENEKDKAVTCGFFRLERGKELVYTYTYHEMKIILEGTFTITDGATGKTVRATKGDVFYFPKGATITFVNEEETKALAFYTGQRKEGTA